MRLVSALTLLVLATPAGAASIGLATDHFEQSWTALPRARFVPIASSPPVRIVASHVGSVPPAAIAATLEAAADEDTRRELVLNEMATGWDPVWRTAFENLRDARRTYAKVAGVDVAAKSSGFAVLVRQVVDGSGRSVAHDADGDIDTILANSYRRRMAATVSASSRLALQASQRAWVAYRDAFDRFARAIQHPDAARQVDAELSHARAAELSHEGAK